LKFKNYSFPRDLNIVGNVHKNNEVQFWKQALSIDERFDGNDIKSKDGQRRNIYF
jgi:hypothetical protein